MIAWLEGRLREKAPTRVVVDVGGVGYEALIPLTTFTRLPDEGKTVALRIHTHVREDAIVLFGFATEIERAAFELLLHASRVGPKLAQTVLSGLDAEALVRAVQRGDVATLKSVPGIGAKMAERIVVELRDRAAGLAEAGASPDGPGARAPGGEADADRAALVSALVNLQVPRARAERVADEVLAAEGGTEASIEERVRAALRRLAR